MEQAEAALAMAQAELDLRYTGPNTEEREVSEVRKKKPTQSSARCGTSGTKRTRITKSRDEQSEK